MALGDRNWIRQVITGLIQNAIRHARSGGRIALTATADTEMACIGVVDNGTRGRMLVDGAERLGPAPGTKVTVCIPRRQD